MPTIDAVELRRIELPLVRPFRTSFGTWYARDILLVRVDVDGQSGWGECVAGTAPTYSSEYTDGCHRVLADHLLPLVFAAAPDSAASVGKAMAKIRGHRMAKSALETAVLDAELRLDGRSMADRFGATVDRVPVGVSVGITDSLDELVAQVGAHLDEGYARIKIKIEPGWDVDVCRRLRQSFGDGFGLQVDANSAYSLDDLDMLRALDEFGLLLIEQPFAEEELVAHARLAEQIDTPVCLDESIVSVEVGADALALGAADVINIKPGRVGGYLSSVDLHDRCVEAGVPVWCGGMLETGIGRAANLALAAMPGFTLPGDISASDRYWTRDIVTEPFVLDADGKIAVPEGLGSGVEIDRDFLDSVTVSTEVIAAT